VIAYFDTSALVPLLVNEPTTTACGRLWTDAERIVSVPILYTETRAALARAERSSRISNTELARAIGQLDLLFEDIDLVTVDIDLARLGGDLAQRHHLRGYDALHLAGGVRVGLADVATRVPTSFDEFVFATGDRNLADAASAAGLAVARLQA